MGSRNFGRPLIFSVVSLSLLGAVVYAAHLSMSPPADWHAAGEGQAATLVASPMFRDYDIAGITAFSPDGGGFTTLKFGTKCRLLGRKAPDAAIVEIDGRPWQVQEGCVRVDPED